MSTTRFSASVTVSVLEPMTPSSDAVISLVPTARPVAKPLEAGALLTVATAWVSFRFRRLRPLLEGEPIVLVARGRVQESNLRRQRMTVQELLAEARLQSIADLNDLDYAVLETNGRVSFLKRDG